MIICFDAPYAFLGLKSERSTFVGVADPDTEQKTSLDASQEVSTQIYFRLYFSFMFLTSRHWQLLLPKCPWLLGDSDMKQVRGRHALQNHASQSRRRKNAIWRGPFIFHFSRWRPWSQFLQITRARHKCSFTLLMDCLPWFLPTFLSASLDRSATKASSQRGTRYVVFESQ